LLEKKQNIKMLKKFPQAVSDLKSFSNPVLVAFVFLSMKKNMVIILSFIALLLCNQTFVYYFNDD
jgi:hypothetical protein